ncbi:MAG: class I SAM-dependent methyltransferase, partial [Acidimicrobiales bacterium]|nr:class I SAM-dependent methyltransferase [Acidimicrobiales bacterium]
VMSRYSLIHMPVDALDNAFSEFARVFKPGAPALVSFFAANSAEKHGSPFDHKVTTAYELFPDTIVSTMQAAGFDDFKIGVQGPSEGQRPLDHATLLAHRASS